MSIEVTTIDAIHDLIQTARTIKPTDMAHSVIYELTLADGSVVFAMESVIGHCAIIRPKAQL